VAEADDPLGGDVVIEVNCTERSEPDTHLGNQFELRVTTRSVFKAPVVPADCFDRLVLGDIGPNFLVVRDVR
jgi:hypothetical protein